MRPQRRDSESRRAARGGGFRLVAEADQAETVVVNTCGFVEAAKKDSIDALLGAASRRAAGRRPVAVGCLAERYGQDLAESLPDAVLGFDDYPDIADRTRRILSGEQLVPHVPRDRRSRADHSDRPAHRTGYVVAWSRAAVARPASGHLAGKWSTSGTKAARRRPDGAAEAGVGL